MYFLTSNLDKEKPTRLSVLSNTTVTVHHGTNGTCPELDAPISFTVSPNVTTEGEIYDNSSIHLRAIGIHAKEPTVVHISLKSQIAKEEGLTLKGKLFILFMSYCLTILLIFLWVTRAPKAKKD